MSGLQPELRSEETSLGPVAAILIRVPTPGPGEPHGVSGSPPESPPRVGPAVTSEFTVKDVGVGASLRAKSSSARS